MCRVTPFMGVCRCPPVSKCSVHAVPCIGHCRPTAKQSAVRHCCSGSMYTPPKKKLLACSTWILKNRGVTFLVSVDIGHSSAPSGHFKICKWKGEEFLFWVSVYTDTGYGLKQPIKSCEKFRLWVGNGVNLFSVKWSQSRLGVVVLAWSRNRRRSLNWLEPSISDSQK